MKAVIAREPGKSENGPGRIRRRVVGDRPAAKRLT